MYKLIALFSVIAAASAQVLQINPLTLGSNQAGALQTIQLAQGGRIGRAYGIAAPRLAYAAAPQIAYAAPQIAYAQPQIQYAAPIARAHPGYLRADLEGPPEPYTFGFTSSDEFGTQLGRQEQADGSGTVTGSYSLAEADGRQRIVEYIADAAGFRATVKTNEPGTANANPADVIIQSSAPNKR